MDKFDWWLITVYGGFMVWVIMRSLHFHEWKLVGLAPRRVCTECGKKQYLTIYHVTNLGVDSPPLPSTYAKWENAEKKRRLKRVHNLEKIWKRQVKGIDS